MNRFVTNDQLDDLSYVGQLVVSKIVERCEETRVEEEGFKEDAGYFLFKGSPIEVDLVDDSAFFWRKGLVLVHSKISSISDLVFKVEKIEE